MRTAERRKERNLFVHVFGWPIILTVISLIGLLSALFGDGIWDVLSWVALACPICVVAQFSVAKR